MVDYQLVMDHASLIVDSRNVTAGLVKTKARVVHARGASRAAWPTPSASSRTQRMNICIVGTGYVGLVVGACLAETGNQVVGADVDAAKIDGLKQNVLPIYEPGLDQLVERNQAAGRLRVHDRCRRRRSRRATSCSSPSARRRTKTARPICATCSPSPTSIGRHMAREMVIVTKSTVPVGTAAKVARRGRRASAQFPFHVVQQSRVPERRRRGRRLHEARPRRARRRERSCAQRDGRALRAVRAHRQADHLHGHRVGGDDQVRGERDAGDAHQFMNEIANLCERVGANVDLVRRGIGSRRRIGPAFLFPGPGYGGSCFPKDVKALVRTARDCGVASCVFSKRSRR